MMRALLRSSATHRNRRLQPVLRHLYPRACESLFVVAFLSLFCSKHPFCCVDVCLVVCLCGCSVSFRFVPFHPFRFVSFRSISFRFAPFRFVSFRFGLFLCLCVCSFLVWFGLVWFVLI